MPACCIFASRRALAFGPAFAPCLLAAVPANTSMHCIATVMKIEAFFVYNKRISSMTMVFFAINIMDYAHTYQSGNEKVIKLTCFIARHISHLWLITRHLAQRIIIPVG